VCVCANTNQIKKMRSKHRTRCLPTVDIFYSARKLTYSPRERELAARKRKEST
jgi:hypothetical protein